MQKHNYQTINEFKRKNKKLKRTILVLIVPALIGYIFLLNVALDYISRIDWFVPKTIEIINKEAVALSPDDKEFLVQAEDLPFVSAGGESNKISPASDTGIFTSYNPLPEQTDSDPLTMASGKKVFKGAIANNCLPFGTKVLVNDQIYEVQDRMNSRYDCSHFDIFMQDYDEAIRFGKRELAYQILNN